MSTGGWELPEWSPCIYFTSLSLPSEFPSSQPVPRPIGIHLRKRIQSDNVARPPTTIPQWLSVEWNLSASDINATYLQSVLGVPTTDRHCTATSAASPTDKDKWRPQSWQANLEWWKLDPRGDEIVRPPAVDLVTQVRTHTLKYVNLHRGWSHFNLSSWRLAEALHFDLSRRLRPPPHHWQKDEGAFSLDQVNGVGRVA